MISRARGSAGASTRPVLALLAAACLASVAMVVVLGTRLTFFNDDWYFLLQRPGLESHGGLDVLLAPHNSNLVALTAGLYKVLVAVFGMGSQLPFRLVLALAVAAVGVMVFLLVSQRAGQVFGLACASVVLFLGPAWEDLLFFASIDLVGSLGTGLAALWVLGRARPRAWLACLLLICSVGFSNVGVPFALGAAVAVLLRRRPAQLWVAAVPLALFALWWAFDGHSQPSHLSAHNVEHLPRYLLESLSSGLASATGLSRGTVSGTYTRGYVLLGIAAALLLIGLLRGWRPASSVLVPIAVAISFWCLTGASFIAGREPFASRYQLIDVVLLMLIAADLLGPLRLGRPGTAALALLTVAVISSNLAVRLVSGYRFLRQQSAFAKADLGALELGRHLAPSDLWLVAFVAHNPYLSGVTAGRFFAETDAHGAVPADTPQQIAAAPAGQRQGADTVLAFAERMTPSRTRPRLTASAGCASLRTSASGLSPELPLEPGTWLLTETAGRGAGIGVRRFGRPGAAAYIGLIAPGLTERIVVPRDHIAAPWRLSIKAPRGSSASIRLCRA